MFRSIFSFTALILIILMGNINAATYYVDNANGNDGNTGLSTSTPWKTFAKVCNTSLASGSIVSFKSGDRFYTTTAFNKSNITINSYGTGARPVIDGRAAVTPFELSGTNVNITGIKVVNGICNFSLNGTYITIESCNIDSNATGTGYNGNPGSIYSDVTGNHITIRNSTINYNRGGNGYYIDGADNVLLEHDTVMYNAQSGIRVSWGTADGGTADGLTIRYCISRFNGADLSVSGYAFEDDGISNANIYYNVFESGMDGWCGAFGLSTVGTAPHNNNYYNNTFITHGNGYAIQINNYTGMTNMVFKNNIFYNDAGTYGLYFFDASSKPNNWTFDNNLYYGLSSFWHLGSDLAFSGWKSLGYDPKGLNTNPLFTNYGSGNFILQSVSPAINTGINVGLTTDINGITVPSTYPDMGAFQHGSGGGGGGGGTLPTLTLNLTALIEALYAAGGTAMTISPWVTVELHSSTTPYALVDSNSALLNPAGAGTFIFTKAVNGTNYYMVVKSMNTIATWSSSPHSFISSALRYNFTTAVTQAYTDGSNPPLVLHGGKYCIYSGDINHDGLVNKTDFTLIDKDNSTFNYHPVNDLNGDGIISSADEQFIDNNFIISIHRQVPAGAL